MLECPVCFVFAFALEYLRLFPSNSMEINAHGQMHLRNVLVKVEGFHQS